MKDKDNHCIHWLTTQTKPGLKDGGVDDYPDVYVCHYQEYIDGKFFKSLSVDLNCEIKISKKTTPQQMAHCWASNKMIDQYGGISDITCINVYIPEIKGYRWVDYVDILWGDNIVRMTIGHMIEWHEQTDFSKPRKDVAASWVEQYYKCVCHEVQ